MEKNAVICSVFKCNKHTPAGRTFWGRQVFLRYYQ